MGRSLEGADAFGCCGYEQELPEHDVTLSPFSLDKYEVTVGRFRRFVDSYEGPPAFNAGVHPHIEFSGWRSDWNAEMPVDKAALAAALDCDPTATWTLDPLNGENRPINCVSWYVAFAFCAWDGGRLPTEAEYEYAAAGGDENRRYPWGSTMNYIDPIAVYNLTATEPMPVGSTPLGKGRWEHEDLGGNVAEWVLDTDDLTWYAGDGNTCNDCANLADGVLKGCRGGNWAYDEGYMRSAMRVASAAQNNRQEIGLRCAR